MSYVLPCGHFAEDDGDRYYTDHCWEPDCGWRTKERAEADAENAAKMAEARAARAAREKA